MALDQIENTLANDIETCDQNYPAPDTRRPDDVAKAGKKHDDAVRDAKTWADEESRKRDDQAARLKLVLPTLIITDTDLYYMATELKKTFARQHDPAREDSGRAEGAAHEASGGRELRPRRVLGARTDQHRFRACVD